MKEAPVFYLRFGRFPLEFGRRTLVMGILNVTPDSFYDGGWHWRPEEAVRRAEEMVAQGADIVDVGGESTRPGAVPVGEEEEKARVIPVIRALAERLPVPVSVDTQKSGVALEALRAGASCVNDVWGLQKDPEMARVAAAFGVPVIAMHNRSEPLPGGDVLAEVKSFLRRSLEIADRSGLGRERVIVDPGFGFGKTVEQNLEIVARLGELRELGRPILLGPSRKSTIGRVLDLPAEERLEGTAAVVALACAQGVDVVRVHDVREMVRVVRMADAVVRRHLRMEAPHPGPEDELRLEGLDWGEGEAGLSVALRPGLPDPRAAWEEIWRLVKSRAGTDPLRPDLLPSLAEEILAAFSSVSSVRLRLEFPAPEGRGRVVRETERRR